MAEQEQNRSEPATPFKLREAKKRGSVAKSLEFNSFVILAGFLGLLFFLGWDMVRGQLAINQGLLSNAHTYSFELSNLLHWIGGMSFSALSLLAPLFVMLLIVGPLSNILQTGPIFTFFPLKPDWDRINPASGFKRLFSVKLLFEAIKTVIKMLIFGLVLYISIQHLLTPLLGYLYIDPINYTRLGLDLMTGLMFKLLMVIGIIAIIDMAFTRWDFLNKMKMSRRELNEEIKRREGDPRIRAKIRELQREALKRSKALRKLPEADVLITNPTHLAIALKYQRGVMIAPEIIAKGAGEFALKMRQVAHLHGIPILENKPLAQKLFRTAGLDEKIPENLYEEVARVFVWLFSLQSARRRGAAA